MADRVCERGDCCDLEAVFNGRQGAMGGSWEVAW